MRDLRSSKTLHSIRLIAAICGTTLAVALTGIESGSTTLIVTKTLNRSSLYSSAQITATRNGVTAGDVQVLRSSDFSIRARPQASINIQANFVARRPSQQNYRLEIFLLDAKGTVVASVENNLDNSLTILPTSGWAGPVTVLSLMKIPQLNGGTYFVRVSLCGPDGAVRLNSGPGVTQDGLLRYEIGTVEVDASAPPPHLLPAPTLNLAGFHLTFDEPFTNLSITDSNTNDGARWYARNEQCCMATSDGSHTAMVGILDPLNPFSRLSGGGLNIRLQKVANSWTSGVITSVDSFGKGFSQRYGYFEMKAHFPPGENTWPAFWLRSAASKSHHDSQGEIDVVEYIANPGFPNYIATTVHDWSNKTAPAASHHQVTLPTVGFHTYGMMWTESTTTFYFDGAVTMRCATPSIMKQPYYLLVDLGIGSGYPTDKTPPINDMQIRYIRAYSR